ncbi:TolC family protein [Rhodoblastus sp.]|uniref:TolC family protein n=1 Tax=Rhodoblastus sp. TaxID=1962975 RepID=UPI0026039982|nr:TolC family protein [Rhodoblastus sp.]
MAFASCLGAVLGGCAQYHPQPISPAASAAAIDARTLGDPRLKMFIAAADERAPRRWGLSQLTLAALYFHPSLDIARSKLAEAEARARTAGQIPNPSLSFEDLAYNATIAAPSPWTIAPVVNFLIETAGKREIRTAEAENLAAAARDDLATASWRARSQVRDALIDLWAAGRKRRLLQTRLALQNELVGLLEARLAAGQASALDVERERARRNQASLAAQEIDPQEIDARARLAAAIGIAPHALDGVTLSFDALEKPETPLADRSALRREALVGRSDVKSLLADYAAAESALQLQVANQYPNITLSPGYGYDAGSNMYRLLPASGLPIFNQNQGPIAEAEAKRREVAARFVALQEQIIAAADGSAASYRAAGKVLRAADVLAAGEADRARRMEQSFTAGQVDRPALVAAQVGKAVAEESRFDAVVRQRRALGAVEDALQHTFFGPAAPAASDQNPRLAPASSS